MCVPSKGKGEFTKVDAFSVRSDWGEGGRREYDRRHGILKGRPREKGGSIGSNTETIHSTDAKAKYERKELWGVSCGK